MVKIISQVLIFLLVAQYYIFKIDTFVVKK